MKLCSLKLEQIRSDVAQVPTDSNRDTCTYVLYVYVNHGEIKHMQA